MAKENMESFIKKINEDKEFAVNVIQAENKEAVICLAKGSGIEITEEELNAVKPFLQKALAAVQTQDGELLDSELEGVAGGVGDIVINNDFDIDINFNFTIEPSLLGPAGGLVDAGTSLLGSLTGTSGGSSSSGSGTGGTSGTSGTGGSSGSGGTSGSGGLGGLSGWLR